MRVRIIEGFGYTVMPDYRFKRSDGTEQGEIETSEGSTYYIRLADGSQAIVQERALLVIEEEGG